MTLADKIVVLKDGEVMQVGSPMELFNFPENEFVAGFLGSPKMNFFDGVLTTSAGSDTAQFVGSDLSADSVRLVSKDKGDGAEVKLGIRPQHLVLDTNGPLQGTATLVERLGTETVVELETDNQTSFRFASPESLDITHGEKVSFSFDPASAHLF